MAITAFAGPFSNIVLAILFAFPLRIVGPLNAFRFPYLAVILFSLSGINIGLAVFNLLPIFPLDGFSVLRGIFSTIHTRWAYRAGDFMDQTMRYGPMIFIFLLVIDRSLPGRGIIWTILSPAYNLLAWLILGVNV